MLPFDPAAPLRSAIVEGVRGIFNDRAGGETPVQPSPHALFPTDSVMRNVHADVTAMMIGGVAALLMQMLHPAALAGVWDHSRFRDDMTGRLRRTARFIALTSYAEKAEALAAVARVKRIHAGVRGTLPDGTPYRADDPHLLAWVHVCEAHCFLAAHLRFVNPRLSAADRDAYMVQSGTVAALLGADPVPQTQAECERMLAGYRPELRVDARTRSVAAAILSPPVKPEMRVAQRLLAQAAIDLLPDWARRMHGLASPAMLRPAVRLGGMAMASTLRWAFAGAGRA